MDYFKQIRVTGHAQRHAGGDDDGVARLGQSALAGLVDGMVADLDYIVDFVAENRPDSPTQSQSSPDDRLRGESQNRGMGTVAT